MSCGKGFTKKYDLERHNKMVHELIHSAGEAAVFTCNICSDLCTSTTALKKHKIREHSLVAYSCQLCEKGFEKSNQLYMHKYFHHSSKEFKCSCGKIFSRKAHLKDHKLKHCGKGEGG